MVTAAQVPTAVLVASEASVALVDPAESAEAAATAVQLATEATVPSAATVLTVEPEQLAELVVSVEPVA